MGLKRDTADRIIKRGANEKSKRGGIRAAAVKVTTEIKKLGGENGRKGCLHHIG